MKRTKFTVTFTSGAFNQDQTTREVDGYIEGPFGIQQTPRGRRWTVTHLASGLAMPNLDSATLGETRRKAREVASLPVDWSRPFEDLHRGRAGMDWRDVVAAVRAIASGATAAQALDALEAA